MADVAFEERDGYVAVLYCTRCHPDSVTLTLTHAGPHRIVDHPCLLHSGQR